MGSAQAGGAQPKPPKAPQDLDLLQWPPRGPQIAFVLVSAITVFALIVNRPWQVVVAGVLAIAFLAVAPRLKRFALEGPPGRMEGELEPPASDQPQPVPGELTAGPESVSERQP